MYIYLLRGKELSQSTTAAPAYTHIPLKLEQSGMKSDSVHNPQTFISLECDIYLHMRIHTTYAHMIILAQVVRQK